MAREKRIVRASAEEIVAMRRRGETSSDWEAAAAVSQDEVERVANEEEGPLPSGWESAVDMSVPEPRPSIHIRLDASVLRWFKSHGPGYQTRINAVLRAFVRAREREEKSTPKP